MQDFDNLTPDEKNFLLEAPVLITFLIAGADNNIDRQETEWAEKLLEFRSAKNQHSHLAEYYHLVDKAWDKHYKEWTDKLANLGTADEKTDHLAQELVKINPLLTKLHPNFAYLLYSSFRSFALQIAKASGGILSFGAVSPEEHRWVNLPMIHNPNPQV
jgi:hypothetical protein